MENNPRQDKEKAYDPGKGAEGLPPQTTNNSAEEEAIEAVPLYRNFKVVIPLFIVILGIAAFAWNWYLGMRDYVSTDDAYVDANRVAVSAKILGRVDTLLTDEGDTVREGQVVVRLDDIDLRAQEVQVRSAYTLAQENIALAKVNLDRAQTDYKRAATQFSQSVIPKEQYDHAESELESAKARYNIAIAQSNSARAQLGIVETQLRNTVITSPMTGVVSKRWVLSGDVVQPGQPIFTVYDLKNIWVTANLEETSLTALHDNDNVEISVDAYPDQKFMGKVFQIGSNTASQFSLIPPNNASGNFTKVTQRVPVKISILPAAATVQDPQPVQLLPGMSVEVRVKVR